MVKEGFKFAAPPLITGILLIVFAEVLDRKTGLAIAGGVFILLGLFVLYFFRDPERQIPNEPGAVVSPADGHVLEIVDEAWNGPAGKRITIFLSVFDVHVNRVPVAGEIKEVQYRPGRFFAAMRKRASKENEQNVITITTPGGDIVFKQIAGAIARRVICWKNVGDRVALGERVGMIRFGSRVDVWLPDDSEIVVRRGQRVYGGASILAKWKPTA
ncbi:MAG: phosphatidylserine decarboxylase family protein [Candidatus Acidiferrales bacterium]|jgi:phosphatidylserine decarboxylase